VPIHFPCPTCAHRVSVSRKLAGQEGRCPHCNTAFAIPALPHALSVESSGELEPARPPRSASSAERRAAPPASSASQRYRRRSTETSPTVILLIIAGLILSIGSGIALVTTSGAGGGPVAGTVAHAPLQLEPVDVLLEYDRNEVAADLAYKDKWIEISGVVDDVKKDITSAIYVTLLPELRARKLQCFFSNAWVARIAALEHGRPVRIRGTVRGLMENVLLKDCEIVN
jgi:hypothetical protein